MTKFLNTIFISLMAAKLALALVNPTSPQVRLTCFSTGTTSTTSLAVVSDLGRPPTFLDDDEDDDINITFINEDEDDEDDENQPKGQGKERWENLNPRIKQRLIERGQAKAIANKKKREPARDKKRSE